MVGSRSRILISILGYMAAKVKMPFITSFAFCSRDFFSSKKQRSR